MPYDYGTKNAWNSGNLKADQADLPVGSKRCSKIIDPRCQEVDGVQPIDDGYHINKQAVRAGRPTIHMPACKWCQSFFKIQAMKANPERQAKHRRQQRERYHRIKKLGSGKMQVLWDPTGVYPRGALFAHLDFTHTLEGGMWPHGMYTRDLRSNSLPHSDLPQVLNNRDGISDINLARRSSEGAVPLGPIAHLCLCGCEAAELPLQARSLSEKTAILLL